MMFGARARNVHAKTTLHVTCHARNFGTCSRCGAQSTNTHGHARRTAVFELSCRHGEHESGEHELRMAFMLRSTPVRSASTNIQHSIWYDVQSCHSHNHDEGIATFCNELRSLFRLFPESTFYEISWIDILHQYVFKYISKYILLSYQLENKRIIERIPSYIILEFSKLHNFMLHFLSRNMSSHQIH